MLKNTTGRAVSPVVRVVNSLLGAIIWTLVSSVTVAWMINREMLPLEQTGYASMFILLICGVLLARNTGFPSGKQRLLRSLLGTSIYFIGLIVINWLFFGGEFAGFGVTLTVLLVGTALGNLSLRNSRGGNSRRRYKIPKS